MERILQTMDKQNVSFPVPPHPFIFIIGLGEAARNVGFELLCHLRHHHVPTEMDLSGKKVQQGLQLANTLGADYCLILGDEELSSNKVQLKHLASRQTLEAALSDLVPFIVNLKRSHHKKENLH
jgi:histidyl-tRNA synthetase